MSGSVLAQRIAALSRRGRAGLAWEVLRRDPAYRAAWHSAMGLSRGLAGGIDRSAAAPGTNLARRWGLHFCR
ncbi:MULTISPECIES: DUF6499 domain-containing protein [unclassified Novosphingobium]|uniref:transcriptional regulator domain-containing protein n=1 Tax=unclassified Novosphingobium TaxID=2644732 RepID=UPI00146C11F3|nr:MULTISPECIES: DUF6499 domain-containing protein [unclassified Novosphingobium]NMN02947.1 hypothetical protein [Novosphingobium sp. SG919]NMN87066.1 hypothetical protein [Novosphingobium sp. SG916]